MKFIVAGCGYVGEILRQQLVHRGHDTIGLTLSGNSHGCIACDVSKSRSVSALARQVGTADAVVHCASSGHSQDRVKSYQQVYLDGIKHLHSSFPNARLIFTSSTSVYGQLDGSHVNESSPAEPTAETGKILRAAEEFTLSSGGSIARLAGIYGPERSFLLQRFLEGASQIDGRWINQIHRTDAAAGLAFLLESTDAKGTFNIADDTPLSQHDCYLHLAQRFNLPMPPEGQPDPDRKRGWTNKRVSNAKLRALGWTPRFPSYFDALDNDPDLIPSILAKLEKN